jgi:hypothetical protein
VNARLVMRALPDFWPDYRDGRRAMLGRPA